VYLLGARCSGRPRRLVGALAAVGVEAVQAGDIALDIGHIARRFAQVDHLPGVHAGQLEIVHHADLDRAERNRGRPTGRGDGQVLLEGVGSLRATRRQLADTWPDHNLAGQGKPSRGGGRERGQPARLRRRAGNPPDQQRRHHQQGR
jgi:hypothetical protein